MADHSDQIDEPNDDDERRFTRRHVVASGAAFGAAVVWTSQFPFADAAIGRVINASAGPTGTTGPTGSGEKEAGNTGSTGSTATTSSTGAASTGATGATGPGATSIPPFRFPQINVAANGEFALSVQFPAAGDFEFLVTSANSLSRIADALKPGRGRSAFARAHVRSAKAGVVRLKAKPTKQGATLLRRRRRAGLATPLRAYVRFTPTHGHATALTRTVTLKK
ncbi:MAG TPA: hypothetical protein VN804_01975 [Solirubrobacteraceae bacterium]|jgi:hypothetical protein|nr:hypothetical protein [Solirubrobacteraceae bacterium]